MLFQKIKATLSDGDFWKLIFVGLMIVGFIYGVFFAKEKDKGYPENYDQYENCDIRRC